MKVKVYVHASGLISRSETDKHGNPALLSWETEVYDHSKTQQEVMDIVSTWGNKGGEDQ